MNINIDFYDLINYISKQFGVIVDTQPVRINGEDGFLVWDYILFNEITFVNSRTKQYTSMYTSFSDNQTRAKYNQLLSKFSPQESKC